MKKFMVYLALVLCVSGAGAQTPTYFHASGQNILDPDGQLYLVKGIALSQWLNPEAYALRLDQVHNRHLGSSDSIHTRVREILGNDADAEAFWTCYHTNFVTAADYADFAAEGFNTVRVPFNYRLLSPKATPGVYSEEGFQVLDGIIQQCKANGLNVILDMHACPGGQSHDAPSDPEHTYWAWSDSISNWVEVGVACLWEPNADYFAQTGRDPEFNKQRTIDLWRTIAERYSDETAIVGYELINEPFLPYGVHYPDLRDLLVRITAAIREVDTNHMIIVEGNYFAGTLEGLVPAWDDNMALAFHKYWMPTTYESIQTFVEGAAVYGLPLLMTESGENSSGWYYEFASLLESNNIGWCWWGYKKVNRVSAAFNALVTTDYQYVIDNFRDLPIDATQAKNGLMEMANNLASEKCDYDPGYFASLLDPDFAGVSKPFTTLAIPGKIYCTDYDIGHQGVAYYDSQYKNEEGLGATSGNSGKLYRNDGVDICETTEGSGLKVGYVASGEWIRYTVTIASAGTYDITIRTASPVSTGRLQLYHDGAALTSLLSVPKSGSYEIWKSITVRSVSLPAGEHQLELRFPVGGFDIASMEFKKRK